MASATGEPRAGGAPWLLSAPALLLFLGLLVIPLALTAVLSFHSFDGSRGVVPGFTLHNYTEVFSDPYYHEIFLRTAGLALAVTLLSIVFGVPETIILARMKAPWRGIFLIVILGPLLVSVVVRTLGWAILMGNNGLINDALQALGLTDEPVRLLFTMTGVVIALTHVLMPFMVISVWASLQKLDPQVENAALSLGASRFTVWRRVVLPQVTPGLLSGGLIVFALSASALAIPGLLGGRRIKMVATLIYDEYLHELNWPLVAAIALALLVVNLVVMLATNAILEGNYRKRMGA